MFRDSQNSQTDVGARRFDSGDMGQLAPPIHSGSVHNVKTQYFFIYLFLMTFNLSSGATKFVLQISTQQALMSSHALHREVRGQLRSASLELKETECFAQGHFGRVEKFGFGSASQIERFCLMCLLDTLSGINRVCLHFNL